MWTSLKTGFSRLSQNPVFTFVIISIKNWINAGFQIFSYYHVHRLKPDFGIAPKIRFSKFIFQKNVFFKPDFVGFTKRPNP